MSAIYNMKIHWNKFIHYLDWVMNILIILNAFAFGLLTDNEFHKWHPFFNSFCNWSISAFVVELLIKLCYYKKSFFVGNGRGWNIFDMIIVLLSCLASFPLFSTMRVFRIFRIFRQLNILRLIPSAGQLKIIIEALLASLPGVTWTSAFFLIIIYTYALMGSAFFGVEFPEFFGNVWKSMFTLFQVMTLESWSMDVARPVISIYPSAWVYFVSYVIFSAFIILNIIVALVVNSLDEVKARNKLLNETDETEESSSDLIARIEELEVMLDNIKMLASKQKLKTNKS